MLGGPDASVTCVGGRAEKALRFVPRFTWPARWKMSILEQYYEGILGQLRGEVGHINELFSHHGVKGDGNEAAIRGIVAKFVPRRFGLGSGVVIDHKGNQSRSS